MAVGGVAVTAGGLAAQEKSDTVGQLIKQLLNDSFDVRREAKQKLFELGPKAIPALKASALDKSSDTGFSAVRILSRMMNERPAADSQAARAALAELAKGDDALARQARESLEEARQPGLPGGVPRRPNMGGFGPGVNSGRSSTTTIVNGVRSTTIREPGRQIQITVDPQGPVSITVTDEGKKPKTWSAKSLDQLKKDDPDGFKIYETYNRRMPIVVGPGRLGDLFGDDLFAVPPMRDPFQGRDPFEGFRRRRQAPRAEKEMQDAELLMQDMAELLKSLKQKTNAPEVKRLESKLDALKRNMNRVKQQVQ
jgi:hypothetical protein